MFQGLFYGDGRENAGRSLTKWSARCREDDPPDFRSATIETLENRVMFAVDRQDGSVSDGGFQDDDLACHHENLFTRYRQIASSFNRSHGRSPAGRANDC